MTDKTHSPLRIFVAEDNNDARETVCKLLTTLGHEIAGEAQKGEEFLAQIKKMGSNEIDVCLLDAGMPPGKYGGLELGRHAYYASGISSILYTGHDDPALIEAWMEEEYVIGYVLKGAPTAQLQAALGSARRNKAMIERYRILFRACTCVAQDRNLTFDEAYKKIRRYAQNKQIRVEEAAERIFTQYEDLHKTME